MTEHLASAHVRLHQPAFREAFEAIGRELHATKFETMPAPLRGFVRSVEALFGVRVVNKGGLELLEYVMHRGFVVGGTAMGNYLETEIMEHIFKNTAIFTVLASVDVALWTAATGEADSSGTEVSGTAYARENVAAAGWAAISDGATSNSGAVDFGTAGAGGWGTISHVSIETPAGTNRLFHGALAASKTVGAGDTFQFAAGDLDVSVA
jgi:hypothetical protein